MRRDSTAEVPGLVYDRRPSLAGQPSAHAFVIGVSAYPGLPEPDADGEDETFGMRQLTAAAATAAQIADWLLENGDSLPRPLATIRLLLAPTGSEQARMPAIAAGAGEPTLDGFLTAADAWRADAATSRDSLTFFFFAGHGMQGPSADEVLVLKDFAQSPGGKLRMTVTTGSLIDGMAPRAQFPDIARRQLYFIDACRDRPDAVRAYEVMQATDVFDRGETLKDDRDAPQYYGAVPGAQARSRPGTTTLFGGELLRCLRGAAGAREEDRPGWHVSVGSLARALKILERRAQLIDREISFDPRSVGDPSASIVRLTAVPDVEVTLVVMPRDAVDTVTIAARNGRNEGVVLPMPLRPQPYRTRWPAGAYAVDANRDPPLSCVSGEFCDVLPPSWRHELEIQE